MVHNPLKFVSRTSKIFASSIVNKEKNELKSNNCDKTKIFRQGYASNDLSNQINDSELQNMAALKSTKSQTNSELFEHKSVVIEDFTKKSIVKFPTMKNKLNAYSIELYSIQLLY